ncbi:MAG TPA: tetratricopeptide repeat protein [bacterium]|nr:tetratricopeptide repeat protein [bacterium]
MKITLKVPIFVLSIIFLLSFFLIPTYPATVQEVITLYNQKDYLQSIEAAKSVINDPKSTTEQKAQAQLFLAQSVEGLKGKKEALPEYLKVIENYPTSKTQCPYAMYSIFSYYWNSHEYDQAIMILTKAIEQYPDSPLTPGMIWYIPLCYAEKKQYAKALEYALNNDSIHLREPSAAGPVAQAQNGPLQKIIAQWSILAESPDVLLQAKLYYDTTDLNNIQDPIDMICTLLKAEDLNLVRVNKFIQYQKEGKGEDILKDIKVPQARKKYLMGLVERCGNTYREQKIATYLLLMAGDPKQALQKAKKAYSLCPMNQLNQAIMDIAICLKAIDGNIIRANQFIQAQTKGESFPLE